MEKKIEKFWLKKSLKDMNHQEWESLCDGCGKCCLEKIEDEEDGKVYTTAISCRLLDVQSCRCSNYENRFNYMDDCIKLTKKNVYEIKWLPKTCAYRLVRDGEDLPSWHPLLTGDKFSTISSGNSAKNFAIHPVQMKENTQMIDYILFDEDEI